MRVGFSMKVGMSQCVTRREVGVAPSSLSDDVFPEGSVALRPDCGRAFDGGFFPGVHAPRRLPFFSEVQFFPAAVRGREIGFGPAAVSSGILPGYPWADAQA